MKEIVIQLSEEDYKVFQRQRVGISTPRDRLFNAVREGTVLPEHHGRLIDADAMKTMKNIQSANFNAVELIRLWIDKQPTIIEADKGDEE